MNQVDRTQRKTDTPIFQIAETDGGVRGQFVFETGKTKSSRRDQTDPKGKRLLQLCVKRRLAERWFRLH